MATINFFSKLKNKFFKNKKINSIRYNSVFTNNNIVINPYKNKTFFPKNYNNQYVKCYQNNYNNFNDDYYNLSYNEMVNFDYQNNTFDNILHDIEYDYDYYSDIGSFNLRRSISLITHTGIEIDIIDEILNLYD
jgi:hypothetical protein